jgi:ADP-heptose:LPS heptosyltransferase
MDILVLQLGHVGDFIIGLPALRQLRTLFPNDRIRLVVGSWNRHQAEASRLADDVVSYDFFPEVPKNWDGKPIQDLDTFAGATAGEYGLAVDLRVTTDTRFLLQHVNAAKRAAIGLPDSFPFLDIALPLDPGSDRSDASRDWRGRLFGPEQFNSRMPRRFEFRHETSFRPTNLHQIFGPYATLPAGSYRAIFALCLTGLRLGAWRAKIQLDVAANATSLAQTEFRANRLDRVIGQGVALPFTLPERRDGIEFRVRTTSRPLAGLLVFQGVRLHQDSSKTTGLEPALLHTGELASLLVRLIAERMQPLYAPAVTPPSGPSRTIAIAPVSNSDLRDWPAAHYAKLICLLTDQLRCRVLLIGSSAQGPTLDAIATLSGAGPLVENLAGVTPFADVPDVLRTASLVICNNSGIAHLAAASGLRVLALYAGSHPPQEWGPRGAQVRVLTHPVPCAPCRCDWLADCTEQHICMQGLLPETVFARARDWLEDGTISGG